MTDDGARLLGTVICYLDRQRRAAQWDTDDEGLEFFRLDQERAGEEDATTRRPQAPRPEVPS